MVVQSISFSNALSAADPQSKPVLIVGQLKFIQKVGYNFLKVKLAPRVPVEVFEAVLAALQVTGSGPHSLYLNLATVAVLPEKVSRHNAPARPHALTRIVKACSVGVEETIVIICRSDDVLASACAVARAFPLFTRKSGKNKPKINATDDCELVDGEKPSPLLVTVEFIIVDDDGSIIPDALSQQDLDTLTVLSNSVRETARVVDTPTNEMHTDIFLEEVNNVAASIGITPSIVQGEDLKTRGFGGIYGVGKAAEHQPALAVLSYKPEGATETIAWVGKGIVYDTGGLSIKSKTGMPGMKRDCGGAAAVLYAFQAAVMNGFTQNLHAVLCLAENSVGPKATRPDDIHTLYSGKTVEINNTDAEGRLVLGDGVAYARKDLEANIILDIATLTGAQGIATGRYHAAVVTNDEEWESSVVKAGKMSGDLSHPLPYAPEFHYCEFDSAIADMKNSVASRDNAQASCAALFIMSHVGFDFPGVWIHVDMAAPGHTGERATGYGVALLNTLFGAYSKSRMLRSLGIKASSPKINAETPTKKAKVN
ncbi:probable aminopeptidase NPEPL1 [Artemia franciscana]|uniref:Cytosol aminopeptidase domain-containing protein n=1 Tax=Artemia franciscana TaxID=6661 RepID=A0AA88L523_ARTSF|nr:hypothetical protein QYM36_013941 [Artemia franciscana]